MQTNKADSARADSYDMLVSSFVSILILASSVFVMLVVFKGQVPFLNFFLYGSIGITLLASVISVSRASRRWAIVAFFGAILPYIGLLLLGIDFLILAFILSGMQH